MKELQKLFKEGHARNDIIFDSDESKWYLITELAEI